MLSPRENLLELLNGGTPDRLTNQYEPFAMIYDDPVRDYFFGGLDEGKTITDPWGTQWTWPEGEPGSTAVVTDENKVVPDITEWKEHLTLPDIKAHCSTGWEEVVTQAEAIDRSQYLVTGYMACGIFEQCHFLMGFEDALCNVLMEPDDMKELIEAIFEVRMQYAQFLIEKLHPDAILSHDDWGTKTSLFMPPDVWRDLFKEPYAKLYQYMHDNNVIVVHHSDSFCEPIVPDMIDIGVDIWQGALPQNDLKRLQKEADGKLIFMGGIDAAVVDREDSTEEEIRAETREACKLYGPEGSFIPCLTYGGPGGVYPNTYEIITDEIMNYNQDVYGIHA